MYEIKCSLKSFQAAESIGKTEFHRCCTTKGLQMELELQLELRLALEVCLGVGHLRCRASQRFSWSGFQLGELNVLMPVHWANRLVKYLFISLVSKLFILKCLFPFSSFICRAHRSPSTRRPWPEVCSR